MKDCEICMKKFPKEDSSECVKKALAKEGKKECMECAKCEKPKMPFAPVQVGVISKTIDQKIKLWLYKKTWKSDFNDKI